MAIDSITYVFVDYTIYALALRNLSSNFTGKMKKSRELSLLVLMYLMISGVALGQDVPVAACDR